MNDAREAQLHVEQKWGFGMAPVKPAVQAERAEAVSLTLRFIESGLRSDRLPDALSTTKGLFTRCWKQDQWDWFTVWTQLGRPGQKRSRRISQTLGAARSGAVDLDRDAIEVAAAALKTEATDRKLRNFLEPQEPPTGFGYIYMLSTRESPDILKIGYTDRSVEERVREINSATGVAIPYGVRAVWTVESAREAESEIHNLLDDQRIRRDREFFRMDYRDAFRIVADYVRTARREA